MGQNILSRDISARAAILTRRSYNRPLDSEGTIFETWEETVQRVRQHQIFLWERALGDKLNEAQQREMDELCELILNRMVSPAGRTLWLGGTETVRKYEIANFNCCFCEVRSIHDLVDIFWLLLNGCGTGFKPVNGSLSGFTKKMEVKFIRSARTDKGKDENIETFDQETKTWTIVIGDSAQAWAKSIGKIVAGKFPAKKLIIDLSQVRPAGLRLKGYGWISNGDKSLFEAYTAICEIMNRQAGKLLSKIDILDIVTWLGTVLSSRRSAEMAIMDYNDPEWYTFATAKAPNTLKKLWHRSQSNNSLVFWEKPTVKQLKDLFEMIVAHGGAEPGFINGQQALKRAPWFKGLNPCGEILLGNQSVCNLCEIDVAKFRGDHMGLHRAIRLIARANYRQTTVQLRDGILQDAWHQTNEFLRLCGVGLTGIVRRPDLTPYDYKQAYNTAVHATYSMADELGSQRPKNVSCLKPSGCRPWYALTTTTAGILTLEELFEEHPENQDWADFNKEISVVQQNGETKPITKTFNNGISATKIIKLSYGITLESSPEHPWFIAARYDKSNFRHYKGKQVENAIIDVNEWVAAKDIKPEDIVQISLGHYTKETHSNLKSLSSLALSMRNDATPIRQPAFMSPDLAWLLGYLWGDGAMSPGKFRIRFVDNREEHLGKAARILREQFEIDATVRKLPDRNASTLEVGSKYLWHWLIKNGVWKYFADKLDLLPYCVRTSSQEDILAFFAGLLDSDGCCHAAKQEKNIIIFTTADRFFAKHLQNVAWAVGLGLGCSHNKLGKNLQKRKDMYLLSLGCAVDVAAFNLLAKHSCKAASAAANKLPWAHELKSIHKRIIGKVMRVEDGPMMPTYDIEVAENHWYYAGAIKCHNTLSKAIFDTTEGAHRPKGKYIINNIIFSRHDPLVKKLLESNYQIFDHPNDNSSVVIKFPVCYDDVEFDRYRGREVDRETAVSQLERYKLLQQNYVDQNTSITVSYEPTEVKNMVDWFMKNWDNYVATSFLFRADVDKTAKDLGFPYLPQEVVTKEVYEEYNSTLLPVDIDNIGSQDSPLEEACAGGSCPVR